MNRMKDKLWPALEDHIIALRLVGYNVHLAVVEIHCLLSDMLFLLAITFGLCASMDIVCL